MRQGNSPRTGRQAILYRSRHRSWRGGGRQAVGAGALLFAGALSAMVAAPARGGDDAALAERLRPRLSVPALRGARISALVADRADGRTLFAWEPDRALVPASNLKILTGIAALAALGPAHRFETQVLTSTPLGPDGAVEALFVRGGGDPVLTSERLWRLAADLRMRGLRAVRGDLVLDDTLFDDERWHARWGDVSARAYHAPVGSLMANYGAFRVTVTPGAEGGPASVRIDPPVPYLQLRARVRTVAGGRADLWIRRASLAEAERVEVGGTIPAGSEPREFWRSVSDPARYAGSVLRMQLQANGIEVRGGVQLAPVPARAHLLYSYEGASLAEICRLFLKHSNNVIAEALLKNLALVPWEGAAASRRGDWPRGVRAERRVLRSLGLDLDGVEIVDGSGLSRDNRVPARLLVEALRLADRSFDFGPEFVGAIPIAGTDGTLEKRAAGAGGRMRAKTGLLTGVTGLAGYARRADGHEVVFAVLANGYPGGDRGAMDALDGFVEGLVR